MGLDTSAHHTLASLSDWRDEGIVRLPRKWLDFGDVGSAYPGAGEGPKGWSVRPLKRYVSWVQNVVRQFGLYPQQALDT